MNWALAALLVLGVALAAGFAWYERTRPPAKVVALVATLAALAALGRIAFAPVPNVKPTTDIVLIAGYALGGAPGFVAGAVAALTSNLFFGQGPWTPWQMAAWGLVGLFGAGLARASGRRLGRVPLAVACAAAGLGFGVIMNLSTWTTFAGQQTLDRFLAISATSLPWDLAHAAGNLVFFLAFGPMLVRSLQRFRARMTVRWAAPAALALALLALPVATAAAATPTQYLQAAQNADGGWGPAPGTRSNPAQTAWAAMGLAAAGRGPRAAGYLRAQRPRGTADIERTILGLAATGAGTEDLVATLRTRRRADGSFGGLVNVTAFAVLALRAGGVAPDDPDVRAAAAWIARRQNRDGGFNYFGPGGPSGSDDTSAALMALAAAGRRATPAATRAATWLRRHRNRDGGWPLAGAGPSNSQSTAWAVQALVAVHRGGIGPGLAYLRRMRRPDGSVRYSRTSSQTPVWVTAQALAALRAKPMPIVAPRRAAPPAPRPAAVRTPSAARVAGAILATLMLTLKVT